MKSSTAFFPKRSTAGGPLWDFCLWAPEIHFCGISRRAASNTRSKRCKAGKRRACDVIRLRHADGELYFMNLLSLGFPADVGELTNRRFKRWGELGYIFGVLTRLAALKPRAFPHRLDGQANGTGAPALFLAFSNSKFTGGKMMIAPKADPTDGQIEYVRWAPVGRMRLLWLFPRLFTGTHIDIRSPRALGVRRVDFDLDGP